MQTEAAETQQAEGVTAEPEQPPADNAPEANPADGNDGDEEAPRPVVTFGEEAPPPEKQPTPPWVKELRKRTRELERENRELKARTQQAQQAPTLGPRPTLADCEFDEARLQAETDKWFAAKAKVDAAKAEAERAARAAQEKREQKLTRYVAGRQDLGVEDFEDAEAEVLGSLELWQQEIILNGAQNASALVYALGKHPSQAKTLAGIKEPIEFAVALGRLESTVKIHKQASSTSKPPPPEERVRASGGTATRDRTLERLEQEADRTGDRTKLIAYKRSKKG